MSFERRSLLRLLVVAAALGLFLMHGPVLGHRSAVAAPASATAGESPTGHSQQPAAPDAMQAAGASLAHTPGTPMDPDHGAHLLHLCLAILVAIVAWALAALIIAIPAWFDARRSAAGLRGTPSGRPPPYGVDLLNRLSVSLT